MYKPVWYRYRFVTSDGRYGGLSPWSEAVYAGMTLPGTPPILRKGGVGGTTVPPTREGNVGGVVTPPTCNSNEPYIGIPASQVPYSASDEVYINIHRIVGTSPSSPPLDSTVGDIVGIAVGPSSSGYYTFVDAGNNPCSQQGSCNTSQECLI